MRRPLAIIVLLILFTLASETAQGAGRSAILVGIDQYAQESQIPMLQSAASDAQKLGRILSQSGYECRTMTDDEATKERITEASIQVEQQTGQTGELDVFLFHFSGRGTRIPDDIQADETQDGLDECILPSDAAAGNLRSYIRDDALARWISAVRAKQVILILDCAFWGDETDATIKGIGSLPEDAALDGVEIADGLPPDAVIIAAALPGARVEDGVFTTKLLEACVTEEADEDGDRIISFTEAYQYASRQLHTEQPPRLVDSGEGASIPLAPLPPLSRLRVQSDPTGAEILIYSDSERLSLDQPQYTPAMIPLKHGAYGVQVQKPGFVTPKAFGNIILKKVVITEYDTVYSVGPFQLEAITVLGQVGVVNKAGESVPVADGVLTLHVKREVFGHVAEGEEIKASELVPLIIRKETKAEVVLLNRGSLRPEVFKGEIKQAQVRKCIRFQDEIVVLELTGNQLKSAVEHSNKQAVDNRKLILLGLDPVGNTVNGCPINPNEYYSVAANDFLAEGGDYYHMVASGRKKKRTGLMLPQVIIDYIQATQAARQAVSLAPLKAAAPKSVVEPKVRLEPVLKGIADNEVHQEALPSDGRFRFEPAVHQWLTLGSEYELHITGQPVLAVKPLRFAYDGYADINAAVTVTLDVVPPALAPNGVTFQATRLVVGEELRGSVKAQDDGLGLADTIDIQLQPPGAQEPVSIPASQIRVSRDIPNLDNLGELMKQFMPPRIRQQMEAGELKVDTKNIAREIRNLENLSESIKQSMPPRLREQMESGELKVDVNDLKAKIAQSSGFQTSGTYQFRYVLLREGEVPLEKATIPSDSPLTKGDRGLSESLAGEWGIAALTLHDKAGNTTHYSADQINATFLVFASRYLLGKYCFDAEDYTEALSQFEQVSPPSDDARYLTALVHYHQNDLAKALATFQTIETKTDYLGTARRKETPQMPRPMVNKLWGDLLEDLGDHRTDAEYMSLLAATAEELGRDYDAKVYRENAERLRKK